MGALHIGSLQISNVHAHVHCTYGFFVWSSHIGHASSALRTQLSAQLWRLYKKRRMRQKQLLQWLVYQCSNKATSYSKWNISFQILSFPNAPPPTIDDFFFHLVHIEYKSLGIRKCLSSLTQPCVWYKDMSFQVYVVDMVIYFQPEFLLTYLLTYSMELSPSWEANWFCS